MVSRQAGKKFSSGALSSSTEKHNKKWTGTVAGDRGNKALDMDTVRLLKTQDIGYLRTVRNIAAKEVQDLEERAVVAGAFAGVDVNGDEEDDDEDDFDSDEDDDMPKKSSKPKAQPKKIIFADSVEEVEKNLPDQEDDSDVDMDSEEDDDDKRPTKTKEARKQRENAARLARKLRLARKKLKALTAAENELELQRARMAKTATVGGITKNGKKIKIRERKR